MSGSTAESTQGLRLLAAAEAGEDLVQRLEQLNAIGASLSAERDINRLLESILVAAKTITRADGGTLYRVADDRTLRFEIVRTTSLQYYLGGTTGNAGAVLSDPPRRARTASRTTAWSRPTPR